MLLRPFLVALVQHCPAAAQAATGLPLTNARPLALDDKSERAELPGREGKQLQGQDPYKLLLGVAEHLAPTAAFHAGSTRETNDVL